MIFSCLRGIGLKAVLYCSLFASSGVSAAGGIKLGWRFGVKLAPKPRLLGLGGLDLSVPIIDNESPIQEYMCLHTLGPVNLIGTKEHHHTDRRR